MYVHKHLRNVRKPKLMYGDTTVQIDRKAIQSSSLVGFAYKLQEKCLMLSILKLFLSQNHYSTIPPCQVTCLNVTRALQSFHMGLPLALLALEQIISKRLQSALPLTRQTLPCADCAPS